MNAHEVIQAFDSARRKISALLFWQKTHGVIRAWREQARQRQTLAMLSDDALKDLGLSRADAEREGSKWFWEGPFSR
ncbi:MULTISPECIES: DUF1127 domain-containing protein [Pseudomonas]|uniref:DUF1127 domain-containing protein n=2 Tax=Pseudomonas TaxID=286 RepID=A0A2X2EGW5_PSELU|nr:MULTISPECIES: DUF1127 domain-containing protein [Pseudomonas]ENA29607.1 hypothetical protein HMPREF1487_07861 [Pseudomonas sp. HPB0071]MBF8640583.1 DUF1127 domain-containing protein [Pseudomonas zeshuii]MDN3236449.1 DUF1127 domain-containing protein [Pseudomonas sp. WAC2]RRW49505.1 DUF1127 domain-containing protein [Pseudomonas luteola]SEQ52160.1 Uncharacterized conserved protein YjiS, DUF1127 family [Pseudomonas lutea]